MLTSFLDSFRSGKVVQPLVVAESDVFSAVSDVFGVQVTDRTELREKVIPDLHVWDFSESGKIEYARTVNMVVAQKPQGDLRLCILLDVHFLTDASANSLLKILEESQPKTLFLITTASVPSLLPTIRSRVIVTYNTSARISDDNPYVDMVDDFVRGERAPLIASILNDNPSKDQCLAILDCLQPYIKDGTLSADGVIDTYMRLRTQLETSNVIAKYHLDALFFELLDV